MFIEKELTKEEIEAEIEELENWTPEFNSEEYDAGIDRFFNELEARDERIEELRKMLIKFN